MKCPVCGNDLADTAAFCPTCGTRVDGKGASAPVTPVAEQGGGSGFSEEAARFTKGVTGAVTQAVSQAADKLNEMAGGTGHVELRFGDFFDSVFKHHKKGEAEELFICGTPSTTPKLADVSREWPHPWLYSRVFGIIFLALAALWLITGVLGYGEGYPGFFLLVALLVNFSVLVFFFETNALRNMSLARSIMFFLIGGTFSLLGIEVMYAFVEPIFGTTKVFFLIVVIMQQIVNAVLIAYFLRGTWHRGSVLTGMLVGAAIGAGAAVFFNFTLFMSSFINSGFSNPDGFDQTLLSSIGIQAASWALTDLGGTVVRSAVIGGAMMLCGKKDASPQDRVRSSQFLSIFTVVLVLSCLWRIEIPVLSNITFVSLMGTLGNALGSAEEVAALNALSLQAVLLIIAIWIVVIVLLHRGIAQVNELAEAESASAATASAVVSTEAVQDAAESVVSSSVSVTSDSDSEDQ